MATEKVGVYRKYRGPVPADQNGQPLPKKKWADKRPFSWAARWFGTDGQRYSKSFKTRKEAERFAEAKQSDVRQGKADPPQRKSLREFSQEHKQLSKGSMARTTLIMQLAVLRLFAERVGWECDLQRVHPRDIEAFRAHRSEAGLAPATVNKEVKQLKRLFNLAISRGYLLGGSNPCGGVSLMKVGEKRPRYLAPAQFELLYGQASKLMNQTLLVVLYTTAVRREEAMNITWDDIDFDASILHVARRDGQDYVQAWTPKDHERREIPLPKQAVNLLRELKRQAPKDCPYVFMDEGRWNYYRQCVDQGKWVETRELVNNVLRKFKTLCKRAKIASSYTLHDLRRSCITNWARKGLPIHVTQKLAGHADIKTTQKFYLSVQDDDLKAARRAQQQIICGLAAVAMPTTDPKLTHTAQKREFSKRKVFGDAMQLPTDREVA